MKNMNPTLIKILSSREDLSDYVFHFTKKSKAKDTLESILKDKAIKDIHNTGRICFTEAPVTMLPAMFEIFEAYIDPMYAPYGIGLKKEYLWNFGGRPVIYGDDSDRKKLCEVDLDWRFESINPGGNDFSWLREWRTNILEVPLNTDDCIVITKSIEERVELTLDLRDIEIDAEPEADGSVTYFTGVYDTLYKSVSLKEIHDCKSMSKLELQMLLEQQKGEERIYLGSKSNW